MQEWQNENDPNAYLANTYVENGHKVSINTTSTLEGTNAEFGLGTQRSVGKPTLKRITNFKVIAINTRQGAKFGRINHTVKNMNLFDLARTALLAKDTLPACPEFEYVLKILEKAQQTLADGCFQKVTEVEPPLYLWKKYLLDYKPPLLSVEKAVVGTAEMREFSKAFTKSIQNNHVKTARYSNAQIRASLVCDDLHAFTSDSMTAKEIQVLKKIR